YGLNAQRSGALLQVLSASGKDIVPILKEGSKASREQNDAMAKTAQIIRSKGVAASSELFSSTDCIGDWFAALQNTLLIELAPTITKIAEQFQSFVANQGPKFTKTIAGFIHHIKTFAVALTAAFGVVAVGKVVSGITAIITGVRAL